MKNWFWLIMFYSITCSAQQVIKRIPRHLPALIVLTYDDALNSQTDLALPQLEAAGLKATFFLTGYLGTGNIAKWRRAARQGYELANHTIFHPCCDTANNRVASKKYSVESMIREIGVMNAVLFAIDHRTERTFAYPCMDTVAGGISYVSALQASGLIRAARLGGDTEAVITDLSHFDLMRVPAYAVDGGTLAKKLICFVRSVERQHGIGIFVFHGIGGDYISISRQAHQALLNYLVYRKGKVRVVTFQRAIELISTRKIPCVPHYRSPLGKGHVRGSSPASRTIRVHPIS